MSVCKLQINVAPLKDPIDTPVSVREAQTSVTPAQEKQKSSRKPGGKKKSDKKPVKQVTILIGKATFRCSMRTLAEKAPFFKRFEHREVLRLPSDKVKVHAFTAIYNWITTGYVDEDSEYLEDVAFAAYYLGVPINFWGPLLIRGVEKRKEREQLNL